MTDWGLIDPGATDPTGTDDDAVLDAMVEVEQGAAARVGPRARRTARRAGAARSTRRRSIGRRFATGVARDGVPVVALVPMLRAQLEAKGLSADRLHLGATSQDIVDTALVLVSQRALAAARASLVRRPAARLAIARRRRATQCAHRPLARPPRRGEHARRAGGRLARRRRLGDRGDRRTAFPVQFGGAVGTGTAADAAAGSPSAPMTSAPSSPTSSASPIPVARGTPSARPCSPSHRPRPRWSPRSAASPATSPSSPARRSARCASPAAAARRPCRTSGTPSPPSPITAAAVEAPGAAAGHRERRDRRRRAVAPVAGTPSGRALRRLARLARSSADAASRLVARARVRSRPRGRDPRAGRARGRAARPRRARRGIRSHRRRAPSPASPDSPTRSTRP